MRWQHSELPWWHVRMQRLSVSLWTEPGLERFSRCVNHWRLMIVAGRRCSSMARILTWRIRHTRTKMLLGTLMARMEVDKSSWTMIGKPYFWRVLVRGVYRVFPSQGAKVFELIRFVACWFGQPRSVGGLSRRLWQFVFCVLAHPLTTMNIQMM